MSASEFEEWKLYYQLEPFGEMRADLRSGVVAATIANTNRDPKKRRQPYTPREFMAGYEFPDEEPSGGGLVAKVAAINAALGGEDRRWQTSSGD